MGVITALFAAAASMVGFALADYNACVSSNMHFEYGQSCYQMTQISAPDHSHAMAQEGCAAQGGHLAVAISGRVRNEIAKLTPNGAFVALQQEAGDGVNGGQMKTDNWFWHVDGLLHLAADPLTAGWAVGEPDDGEPNTDSDMGLAQYGAVKINPNTEAGELHDEMTTSVAAYACQFRRDEGILGLYEKGKRLVIPGKMGNAVTGVSSVEKCAINCYKDPACLAFNYANTAGSCEFVFERPQDTGTFALDENVETNVWVKQ